jgi:nicotinamide-nucleotide amidase
MEVAPNPFRAGGKSSWVIMLPGPPRELRPMFTDSVVPLLRRVLPIESAFVCRTLRTTGIGESIVQQRIKDPLQALVNAGLELGYCARPGEVDVRMGAYGADAEKIVHEAEQIVGDRLGLHIFGRESEELELVVVRLLTGKKQTLALAESCTGGLLANRVTDVPGASAVLVAGLVTYSNVAKQKFLGVRAETLAQHGAVSEAVAREMADAARKETGAAYAPSVTAIPGPTRGSAVGPCRVCICSGGASNEDVGVK